MQFYKPTREVRFENWFQVAEFLTNDEVDSLKADLEGQPFQDSVTINKQNDYRISKHKWISFQKNGVYDKMWEWANTANDDLWGFESEYGIGGKYDWHLDLHGEGINHRKVSIIVGMNDEYEGGEVQFRCGRDNQTIPINKGNAILFPSYYLHRVMPVTKGFRQSLVAWVSGDPYK